MNTKSLHTISIWKGVKADNEKASIVGLNNYPGCEPAWCNNDAIAMKELIIKEQHNCKATGYWKTNSVKYNFLLLAHEYLFVFRKM